MFNVVKGPGQCLLLLIRAALYDVLDSTDLEPSISSLVSKSHGQIKVTLLARFTLATE